MAGELSIEEQIDILVEKTGISYEEAEELLGELTLIAAYEAIMLAKETGVTVEEAAAILDKLPMAEAYQAIMLSKETDISVEQAIEIYEQPADKRAEVLGQLTGMSPEKIKQVLDDPKMGPPLNITVIPDVIEPVGPDPKTDPEQKKYLGNDGVWRSIEEINRMTFSEVVRLYF